MGVVLYTMVTGKWPSVSGVPVVRRVHLGFLSFEIRRIRAHHVLL